MKNSDLKKFLLENKNPEMRMLERGIHPGKNFWLKTIFPNPETRLDSEKYGYRWINLFLSYPDRVSIVKSAFDWSGEEIPNTWSAFLYRDVDVIYNDPFALTERKELDNTHIESILNEIEIEENIDDDKIQSIMKKMLGTDKKPLKPIIL